MFDDRTGYIAMRFFDPLVNILLRKITIFLKVNQHINEHFAMENHHVYQFLNL